jgi:presenilin-like A22 family membrane protease
MKESPKWLPNFVGGFWPAVFVIAGATLGLSLLLSFSEKKRFYPAMPFITGGILLGLILSYLIL